MNDSPLGRVRVICCMNVALSDPVLKTGLLRFGGYSGHPPG